MADTQNYNFRYKRGILNGIGTLWKSISGNLDASDGEYFNNCINKISRDEHQIENLLKNQISVTTSIIKNFNSTMQKLQIDEETFNKDISEIQRLITDISNDIAFYQAQLRIFDICESLMESYVFLEDQLNDVLNAITFARLKILHSSIIDPLDLVQSLRKISESIQQNNLPIPVYLSNVAQYIDIIELKAYQLDLKVVFVLEIPLVNPEVYTVYRLYPIPIIDSQTGLHHILSTIYKHIARDDDSILYILPRNMDSCTAISKTQKICADLLPYPIDSDSICEAQLLKPLQQLPKTCQTSLIYAKEYNVQEMDINLWLITVSDPLPVTIKCGNKDIVTKIINTNSVLRLQPECSSFVGNTRLHAKYLLDKNQNITYRSHPITIPYSCCDHLVGNSHIPELKPLKLNKLDVNDLNIAQHKLDQYSDQLDKIVNEPFVNKHQSWFSILTITTIIVLVCFYLYCKCRRKRNHTIARTSSQDDVTAPPSDQNPIRQKLRRVIPRRRPSVHPVNVEDTEV